MIREAGSYALARAIQVLDVLFSCLCIALAVGAGALGGSLNRALFYLEPREHKEALISAANGGRTPPSILARAAQAASYPEALLALKDDLGTSSDIRNIAYPTALTTLERRPNDAASTLTAAQLLLRYGFYIDATRAFRRYFEISEQPSRKAIDDILHRKEVRVSDVAPSKLEVLFEWYSAGADRAQLERSTIEALNTASNAALMAELLTLTPSDTVRQKIDTALGKALDEPYLASRSTYRQLDTPLGVHFGDRTPSRNQLYGWRTPLAVPCDELSTPLSIGAFIPSGLTPHLIEIGGLQTDTISEIFFSSDNVSWTASRRPTYITIPKAVGGGFAFKIRGSDVEKNEIHYIKMTLTRISSLCAPLTHPENGVPITVKVYE